ncbi:hypothetical protein H8958_001936 [Nasalis larvatus]
MADFPFSLKLSCQPFHIRRQRMENTHTQKNYIYIYLRSLEKWTWPVCFLTSEIP